MAAELVEDLLGVLELPGDDEGVVEDPVQLLTVAVFLAQDLQDIVHPTHRKNVAFALPESTHPDLENLIVFGKKQCLSGSVSHIVIFTIHFTKF